MPAPGSKRRLLFFVLSIFVVLANGCGRKSPAQPEASPLASVENVRVFGLSGERTDPFQGSNAVATVFIFVATDCPISNRYAPEVQRIQNEFSSKGIAFWLVYPDRDTSADMILKHLKDYHYSIGALRDPEHSLVKRTDAKVTPEAVVFGPNREIVYRGRIDDRNVEFGKQRPTPTRRDLEDALTALLQGKPVPVPSAPAIGCYIAD